MRTDGLCKVVKVILILVDDVSNAVQFPVPPFKPILLSGVVLLGVLAAHLPDEMRKRSWWRLGTAR